jgi:predicted SprT family Zn-dependent metalloprotease
MDFFAKLWERLLTPAVPTAPPKPPPSPATARDVIATCDDTAEELLARAQKLLRTAGAAALAERLTVRWNPSMRSTAGTANWTRCLISLNPQLCQFGDAEVDGTLRHELAHLLAQFRAGKRRIQPHGREWRQACADLGLPGEKRCHDLPLQRRQLQRKHRYRCPACGLQVARVRPMRRGCACLACCRKHTGGRYDERFRFVKES